MKKRIICILLAILLLFSIEPLKIYASENEENICVSEDEAKFLAISCIWNVREECSTLFEKDLYFSHVFTMYDISMNKSAKGIL